MINLVSNNPLLKIVFKQWKMSFVNSTPSSWMISVAKKLSSELTSLSFVVLTMRP